MQYSFEFSQRVSIADTMRNYLNLSRSQYELIKGSFRTHPEIIRSSSWTRMESSWNSFTSHWDRIHKSDLCPTRTNLVSPPGRFICVGLRKSNLLIDFWQARVPDNLDSCRTNSSCKFLQDVFIGFFLQAWLRLARICSNPIIDLSAAPKLVPNNCNCTIHLGI